VAVASAGPYASLHLAPDSQPRQYPTTQFFTGRMLFLTPNQQRQSTEGTSTEGTKRQCVAVASAGPYANQHPTTQFFTGRMLFLLPNQQRQSTEGNQANDIHLSRLCCPLCEV